MLIFQIFAMIVNHLNYAAKYEGTYEGTDEADPETPASPRRRRDEPHGSSPWSLPVTNDSRVAR
jgi:hypothetical protein